MRLSVHCCGWASSLHRPLCAVSGNFFELPVVCSHILSGQVPVSPHCKVCVCVCVCVCARARVCMHTHIKEEEKEKKVGEKEHRIEL